MIETPPENRYPIQTYVMEMNPGAVREAILREMARGGQVFYLYNRVDTIERKVEVAPSVSSRCAYWVCPWADDRNPARKSHCLILSKDNTMCW